MQGVGDPLEQLLHTCTRVPPAQMLLSTAISVTRAFFASAPACKEWEGAVHNMSQCLACVAEALPTAPWAPDFLRFVCTSISKADVVLLLQTISQIVSEAMVAVLYFFMCICCSSASPDWSVLFTSGQSLTQSLALVAQLLQASSSRHPPHPTRAALSRVPYNRLTPTRSRHPSCSGCCSACLGPRASSRPPSPTPQPSPSQPPFLRSS